MFSEEILADFPSVPEDSTKLLQVIPFHFELKFLME